MKYGYKTERNNVLKIQKEIFQLELLLKPMGQKMEKKSDQKWQKNKTN